MNKMDIDGFDQKDFDKINKFDISNRNYFSKSRTDNI